MAYSEWRVAAWRAAPLHAHAFRRDAASSTPMLIRALFVMQLKV